MPPAIDGEVTAFSPTGGAQSATAGALVVYINGVLTPGDRHAAAAQRLADLIQTCVLGVYNKSGGLSEAVVRGLQRRIAAPFQTGSELAGQLAEWGREEKRIFDSAAEATCTDFQRRWQSSSTPPRHPQLAAGWATAQSTPFALASRNVAETARVGLECGLSHVAAGVTGTIAESAESTGRRAGEFATDVRTSDFGPTLAAGVDDIAEAGSEWVGTLSYRLPSVARLLAHIPISRRRERLLMLLPLIIKDQAAQSFLRLLLEHRAHCVHIVAHSQGSLIASLALMVYNEIVPRSATVFHAYAIGPAAPAWPTMANLTVHPTKSEGDPVARFLGVGIGANHRTESIPRVAPAFSLLNHDVDHYINQDLANRILLNMGLQCRE